MVVTGWVKQSSANLQKLQNGTNELDARGAETNQRGVDGSDETNADVND